MDTNQIFESLFSTLGPYVIGFAVLVLLIELAPLFIKRWKNNQNFSKGSKWRSDQELLQWLRNMKPSEFEDYITHLFAKLGYKAQAIGQSHDGGVDVEIEKDGITSYIQCKKFITSEVRLGDVRDFYGALANKLAQGKGYFITTNKFTLEAEEFAAGLPIELIDGYQLIKYVKLVSDTSGPFKYEAKYDVKQTVCPSCGGKLVERSGKYGKFYGCSNYPKCKYITTI